MRNGSTRSRTRLRGGMHRLRSVGFQLPLRLELQDGNNVGGVDDRFIVGSFVFVQKPIISFFRKDSDLLLKAWPDTKLGHSTGRLLVKTAAQRVQ